MAQKWPFWKLDPKSARKRHQKLLKNTEKLRKNISGVVPSGCRCYINTYYGWEHQNLPYSAPTGWFRYLLPRNRPYFAVWGPLGEGVRGSKNLKKKIFFSKFFFCMKFPKKGKKIFQNFIFAWNVQKRKKNEKIFFFKNSFFSRFFPINFYMGDPTSLKLGQKLRLGHIHLLWKWRHPTPTHLEVRAILGFCRLSQKLNFWEKIFWHQSIQNRISRLP